MSLAEQLYIYRARPLRVIDGDTFDFELDLGIDVLKRERVRLAGCNAPEVFGAEASQAGLDAAVFSALWLRGIEQEFKAGAKISPDQMSRSFGSCILKSHRYDPREKYGRLLVSVVRDKDGSDLTVDLIATGHAVSYP